MLKKPPRKTLAENLRALMELHGYSGAEVARRAKIDAKTVTNMLNEKHNPDLDHVAAVAGVFGLSLWQLIMPRSRVKLDNGELLDNLIEHYYASNEQGRDSILKVAEMAASYNQK